MAAWIRTERQRVAHGGVGAGGNRRVRGFRSACRGFTFLELLVALAILGASFTVLLSAHTSAARQEARARRLMTATLLAREVLAETEVEGFPELGEEQGDFGAAFPDYSWARRVESTEFDRVRLVHIQVYWPERGDRTSTEIVYYAVGKEP